MFRKIFKRGNKTDLSGGSNPTVSQPAALPPAQPVPDVPQQDAATATAARAEDHQGTDNRVETEAGRDQQDTRAPATDITPNVNVTRNQQQTATKASGSTRVIANEFQAFWEQELDVRLEETTLDETNYFTPNALPMFEILRTTGRFTSSNTQMLKYFPTYCHYATLIYYSVLFYVQILRAKRAADSITGIERKFLKRFESTFKPESLPIAGQLFPFFSTIIATQIADGKYDWVVPQIAGADLFLPTMSAFTPTNGSCYIQPAVPYMVGLLRLYIMKSYRAEAQGAPDSYFDDDDNAVPFVPSAALHPRVFGMDLHRNTATNADHVLMPYALGVNEPNFISSDTLTIATAKWSNSKFSQINFTARRPAGAAGKDLTANITDGRTPITNLAQFLCMIEEENMEWFDFCIEHATTQAKFSKKIYNLSNVPTTGGNEVLILATYKRKVGANRAATNPFADVRLDIDETNFNWHQNLFEHMTASFATDRANYDRQEELQALTFATNATLPVLTATGNRVGATATQRKGDYFTNPEKTRADHRQDDTLAYGKQMFARWNETIIQKMMSAKPSSL